jgi:hypothetical protein
MSRFLKTYEEWNPFLSKEEKARREEEAKKKAEEEDARKKEAEHQSKKQELTNKLNECDKEILSYKNSIIDTITEKSKSNDIYNYKVELKNIRGFSKLKNCKIDSSIYLYRSTVFNSISLNFGMEFEFNKSDIELPEDVYLKLKKYIGDGIEISSYSSRFVIKTKKSYDIKIKSDDNNYRLHFTIKESLDAIFKTWNIDKHIDTVEKIINTIEVLKEQTKKSKSFQEKSDDILDCFYDVIDLCESHDHRYIEEDNCYKFLFNISSIRIKDYSISYSKSYGHSYGGKGNVRVDKANFYLDDKMLDFFYYLSEAKPRVNDLVPNCQFEVEMKNGQILLTIR